MGFGVHTDRKWQPPSLEGRGRRLKCEAKQILHVTKEVHVRIWYLWRDAGTRNICSEILPQKQKKHVSPSLVEPVFLPKKSEKLWIFGLLLFQLQEIDFFSFPVSCIFNLTVLEDGTKLPGLGQ